MIITNAKYIESDNGGAAYVSISATIDGTTYSVPTSVGNTHYDEILRQVEAGTLTVEDAD